MKYYLSEQISDHVYRIKDHYGVAVYLVVGTERACLIDTGYGLKGLRETVKSITKLPIIVLLTHGHVDHALGIYEFDTVYMSHYDLATYQIHSDPTFRPHILKEDCLSEDAFQAKRAMEFLDVKDGQEFDLGGITVRAYHIPGHTQGMMVYLICEERMILFGDACGPNTMIMEDCSTTLAEYSRSLQKLKEHEAEYDRVIRNHGTCESPKQLLDNVIAVCEKVQNHEDDHVLLPEPMQQMFRSKLSPVPKCYCARSSEGTGLDVGNINYREDKV